MIAIKLAEIAVLLALLSGCGALFLPSSAKFAKWFGVICLALSGVLASIAGLNAIITNVPLMQAYQAFPSISLAWFNWQLCLDGLSGFFLLIIGVVTIAVAMYCPGYLLHYETERQASVLHLCTGLFVAGMMLVLLAANVLTFMFSWELMSLASFFLVAYHHSLPGNRSAAFLYLVMAHISGLLILLAFAVLTSFSTSMSFADFISATTITPTWTNVAFALALLGFGTKAGLVPMHVWLPKAHPAAPSHISALMSGVMLKVAVYGFVRFCFCFLGAKATAICWQWGAVVLAFGVVATFLGILYAMVETDLKRLLAYSSIENIGIIFIGLGLAMIFYANAHPLIGALALTAALLHCLNHALFKSLLFLGAGSILAQTHERNLDNMGGLIQRMPGTAALFLLGSLSIAALPPFNGFVTEWLTLQTFLQAQVLPAGFLRILLPLAAAILVLASGLAAACFVKVYGIAFLGKARSKHVHKAHEARLGMRLAMAWLAIFCIVIGIVPFYSLKPLAQISANLLSNSVFANAVEPLSQLFAGKNWLALMPFGEQAGSYMAIVVWLGLAVLLGLVIMLFKVAKKNLRMVLPWDCGFGGLTNRMQYTATAFAMPLRRIFQAFWQIKEVKPEPRQIETTQAIVEHHIELDNYWWRWVYQPWQVGLTFVSKIVTKFQSGNLRIYLVYVFVTLVLLLWLI